MCESPKVQGVLTSVAPAAVAAIAGSINPVAAKPAYVVAKKAARLVPKQFSELIVVSGWGVLATAVGLVAGPVVVGSLVGYGIYAGIKRLVS